MQDLKQIYPQPEGVVDVRRHKETNEPHILTYLGKDFYSKEHTELVVMAMVRKLCGQIVWRNWVITILVAQILILVVIMIYR